VSEGRGTGVIQINKNGGIHRRRGRIPRTGVRQPQSLMMSAVCVLPRLAPAACLGCEIIIDFSSKEGSIHLNTPPYYQTLRCEDGLSLEVSWDSLTMFAGLLQEHFDWMRYGPLHRWGLCGPSFGRSLATQLLRWNRDPSGLGEGHWTGEWPAVLVGRSRAGVRG